MSPLIDLDAADLRPLAGAVADLLARLQDYRRVGEPAQYQAADLLTRGAWGQVQMAVLATLARFADLGLRESALPIHTRASPDAASAAQGLWTWLRHDTPWAPHPGQRALPDPGPLILRLSRDLGAMGGQAETNVPAAPETTPANPTLFRWGDWDLTEAGFATYKGIRFDLVRGNRRLLARLIRGQGRPVHADHLIDAASLTVDRRELKTYISRLRRVLRAALASLTDWPADPIPYTDPDSYRLVLI
jgi:hypothetical protein